MAGRFSVNLSPLVNQVTLVNPLLGTPFAYNEAYSRSIRLSGEATPEPSTIILSGIGLLAVAVCCKFRRGASITSAR